MTPLMSDTFFGHFCWYLCYKENETALKDFLVEYENESPCPVLFSSAFPAGKIPRPVLPPLSHSMIRSFVEKNFVQNPGKQIVSLSDKQKYFIGVIKIKAWNKVGYLSMGQWMELKDNYSEKRMLENFYEKYLKDQHLDVVNFSKSEMFSSNTVNRISHAVSADAGGFFQREKTWFYKDAEIDLYVDINTDDMVTKVDHFLTEYLPQTGFGADKSVGMGVMEIKKDDSFKPSALAVNNSNARLALSLTSFPGIEKYNAYYSLKTKFGKLGGNFAFSSPTGGNPRPFKKPVLMYEPGAVFFSCEPLSTKSLLANIHSDQRIRHCGIPVTLPFKVNEDVCYENKAA